MSIVKIASCKTGTYEKDGQTKNRYARVGVILKTSAGLVMKLDVLPVNFDGTIWLNDPDEDKGQQRQAPPPPPPPKGNDDDFNF